METSEIVAAMPIRLDAARIEFDETAVRAKVGSIIEKYDGLTAEAAHGMDTRDLKSCRAELNALSKDLNDARKAVKRAYNEPLADFEARVKAIDAEVIAPCETIKAELATRDREAKEAMRAHLESVYMDAAPALAEAIGFDALLDPKWLNASYGQAKAENELLARIAEAADGLKTLEAMSLAFPDEAKAVYCRTLSVREAREYDDRRKAEAERIQAMEAAKAEYAEQTQDDAGVYEFAIRCTAEQFDAVRRALDEIGVEKITARRRR